MSILATSLAYLWGKLMGLMTSPSKTLGLDVGTGAIDSLSQFASTIRPIQVVNSLPSSGSIEGDVAFLTTDNKIYRYTGTAWTKAADGADLTVGSVTADAVRAGSIDGMVITGAIIRTGSTGQRIQLDNTDGLRSFDSSGNVRVQIPVSSNDGNLVLAASSTVPGTIYFGNISKIYATNTGVGGSSWYPITDLAPSFSLGYHVPGLGSGRWSLIHMAGTSMNIWSEKSAIDMNANGLLFSSGSSWSWNEMFRLTSTGIHLQSNCDIDGITHLVAISANVLKCNTLQVGTFEAGGTSVSGGIWVNDVNGNSYKLAVIA